MTIGKAGNLFFAMALSGLFILNEVSGFTTIPTAASITTPKSRREIGEQQQLSAAGRNPMSPVFAMSRYGSSRRDQQGRSKRQERVGHLVRTELSRILHTGNIKGEAEYLDDELRKRISIVSADVSPDLRQARIAVSIRDAKTPANGLFTDDDEDDESSNNNENKALPSSSVMDKRRAYSWLVRNTNPLKHSLAQKMSHMKSCPNLSFAQVDVAAAVDVMYLIDKISAGAAKRENINVFDVGPKGVIEGIDFDDNEEDKDWVGEDDDDDFF